MYIIYTNAREFLLTIFEIFASYLLPGGRGMGRVVPPSLPAALQPVEKRYRAVGDCIIEGCSLFVICILTSSKEIKWEKDR